jgi:hypothetical protein
MWLSQPGAGKAMGGTLKFSHLFVRKPLNCAATVAKILTLCYFL